MLMIRCPWCGDRAELEFRHGGEAHLARPADPAALDDAAWAEFLVVRHNARGWVRERWRHIHGCGRFFNALRHSRTDRIATTYRPDEPRPALPEDAP
jgi:sarcosine oxidase subunit delta